MKEWNKLTQSEKNDFIKTQVAKGITSLTDIQDTYKHSFDDGGMTEQEIKQRLAQDWPSSKQLPYYAITADPTFTEALTGRGSIEYFNEPYITYRNGYTKANPNEETPTILYNPNTNGYEDIKLDLLHHYREYDPTYQSILEPLQDSLLSNPKARDNILWNSGLGENFRNKYPSAESYNWNEWDRLIENPPTENIIQGIDGALRGLLASDALRSKHRYNTKEGAIRETLITPEIAEQYRNLERYLQSEVLPELVVTPKANGGNLFKGGGTKSINYWNRLNDAQKRIIEFSYVNKGGYFSEQELADRFNAAVEKRKRNKHIGPKITNAINSVLKVITPVSKQIADPQAIENRDLSTMEKLIWSAEDQINREKILQKQKFRKANHKYPGYTAEKSRTEDYRDIINEKMRSDMFSLPYRDGEEFIPYIPEKSISFNTGESRPVITQTNVLDSLLLNASRYNKTADKEHQITPSEAIGLSGQESAFGRYFKIRFKDKRGYNTNLLQYAKDIYPQALVNYYTNISSDPSRTVLQDAFDYFKQGNYNTGDPSHTQDVRDYGAKIINSPEFQEYWWTEGLPYYLGQQPTEEQINKYKENYRSLQEHNLQPQRGNITTKLFEPKSYGGQLGNLFAGLGESSQSLNPPVLPARVYTDAGGKSHVYYKYKDLFPDVLEDYKNEEPPLRVSSDDGTMSGIPYASLDNVLFDPETNNTILAEDVPVTTSFTPYQAYTSYGLQENTEDEPSTVMLNQNFLNSSTPDKDSNNLQSADLNNESSIPTLSPPTAPTDLITSETKTYTPISISNKLKQPEQSLDSQVNLPQRDIQWRNAQYISPQFVRENPDFMWWHQAVGQYWNLNQILNNEGFIELDEHGWPLMSTPPAEEDLEGFVSLPEITVTAPRKDVNMDIASINPTVAKYRGIIEEAAKNPNVAVTKLLGTDMSRYKRKQETQNNQYGTVKASKDEEFNFGDKISNIADAITENATYLYDIAVNGVQRAARKFFETPDPVSKMPSSTTIKVTQKPAEVPIPQSYTGEREYIFKSRRGAYNDPHRYVAPESIDLNEVTLGYRNRGNRTPITTDGVIITSFNEFKNKKNTKRDKYYNSYYGITKDGKFKVGDSLDDFSDSDMIANTWKWDFVDFDRDANGNIIFVKTDKYGITDSYVPVMKVLTRGKADKDELNLIVQGKNGANQYGLVTGGRLIAVCGNEKRLLSGSVNDIDKQLQEMKKRHHAKSIQIYKCDNGAFSAGWRHDTKNFDAEKQRSYDHQNTGGGHALYLK